MVVAVSIMGRGGGEGGREGKREGGREEDE